MKYFFFFVALAFLAISAFAQTKTTTVSKTKLVEKNSFDKFYERLKVGFWGSYQSSSIGQWDNLALDEYGEKYNDYPHNFFGQVSFNYNFGWKMNFVINPRFTLNTAAGNVSGSKSLFILEDTLVGLQGTIFSSSNGKFLVWSRIGARLPMSKSDLPDLTGPASMLNWAIDTEVSHAKETSFTRRNHPAYPHA